MCLLLAILVVAIMSGCSGSSTGESASPSACRWSPGQDTFRVLVLGDSIAAGFPLTAPNRWFDKVEEGLREALPDVTVELKNEARSATQVDLLERAVATDQDLSMFQVAIVIEGVNDVGVIRHPEWVRRYRAAIEDLEAGGPQVIIGTSPPMLIDGRFQDTFDHVAESLRRMAADGDRLLLDIDSAWHEVGLNAAAALYSDEIHPDLEGQDRMAAMALEIITTEYLDCPSGQASAAG